MTETDYIRKKLIGSDSLNSVRIFVFFFFVLGRYYLFIFYFCLHVVQRSLDYKLITSNTGITYCLSPNNIPKAIS